MCLITQETEKRESIVWRSSAGAGKDGGMARAKWNRSSGTATSAGCSETPSPAQLVQFSLLCFGGTGLEVNVPVIKMEPWASCGSSGAPGLQASTTLLLAATSITRVVPPPPWCSVGS